MTASIPMALLIAMAFLGTAQGQMVQGIMHGQAGKRATQARVSLRLVESNAGMTGEVALYPFVVHGAGGIYDVTGTSRRGTTRLRGTSSAGGRLKLALRAREDGSASGRLVAKAKRRRFSGRVELTEAGASPPPLPCAQYLRDVVMPEVLLPICAQCHAVGGMASHTRFAITPTALGATALSLRRVVDPGSPATSLLLHKPGDAFQHGGGRQIASGGDEHAILGTWAYTEAGGWCEGGGRFSALPNPALVVANGLDGSVTVIDPATLAVAGTVAVRPGLFPHHLDVSPDGRRVLVSALGLDFSQGHSHAGQPPGGHVGGAGTALYELDMTSGELRPRVAIDGTAHNAAYTAAGEVVVAVSELGEMRAYDAGDLTERWRVPVGLGPLEATPTADGAFVVVANNVDATVSVVDLAQRAVVATVAVGRGAVGAWRSSSGELFVTAELERDVRRLTSDLAGVDTTIRLDGIPGQAFVAPGSDALWVAVESQGVVASYDANSGAALGRYPAGTKPHAIAFDPSGTRAFVTDEIGGRVLVMTVADGSVTGEIVVPAGPNGIAWVER
jgi:YVTN family beta-propeller protein